MDDDRPPASPNGAPDDGATRPSAPPAGPAAAAVRDLGAVAPTLPSPLARLVGFAAIIVAGAAGGFIGYAVTELQCTGDCTTASGLGGLVGAAVAAVGVGIVVQLALRAMHEWRTIEARGGRDAERQRQAARQRRQEPTTRPRPRVR